VVVGGAGYCKSALAAEAAEFFDMPEPASVITPRAPCLPLTLNGVVSTTDGGFMLGNGHANTHTLATAGNLTVTGAGKHSAVATFLAAGVLTVR